MYELEVEREFCAAHAIVIRGVRERTHGHNWRVRLVISGETLDEEGLLCDFHQVEAALDAVIAPLRDADLNATAPFDRLNPTAELVAQHLAESVARALPGSARLASVRVTEAPGCAATYRPRA
ncbi:MAG TPA: 6-carboxytetrahydropterin synthase [Phycisphaerales bacterium]|nr:6-carboxytetrahydropterin synthase [Phycisphaerales bacterium]HMP37324.1 6-carboxytetrahydropterin synthase [Phycisphaerales bacterium]